MKKFVFSLICFVVLSSMNSSAATITVELDGSGDYTQIQPALDAAASGDTVLIGPGEFTELIPSYIPGYAWDVEVCAYVHVPNLTIIGAGAGQTVLGPTSYQGSSQTFSPKCMVWLDGDNRFVEGITFRNCYEGIHVINGPIYIDECHFLNNGRYGIIWGTNSTGGFIRNSNFSSNYIDSRGLAMLWTGGGILVEGCDFDNSKIDIKNIQGITILNCEMKNAIAGVEFSAGARGVINGCRIHDCSVAGVFLNSVGPHCEIFDSEISGDAMAVGSYYASTLSVENSVLTGGTLGVLYLNQSGPIEVHNSHLFREGDFSVYCGQPEEFGLIEHDVTGNYWGTTNQDSVSSWIWDQNDDPEVFAIVNYLPMADGPVPTEETSFGSIKAMFR